MTPIADVAREMELFLDKIPKLDLPQLQTEIDLPSDIMSQILAKTNDEVHEDLKEMLNIMLFNNEKQYYKNEAEFNLAQRDFQTYMKEATGWEIADLVSSFLGTVAFVVAILTLVYCKKRMLFCMKNTPEMPNMYYVAGAAAARLQCRKPI